MRIDKDVLVKYLITDNENENDDILYNNNFNFLLGWLNFDDSWVRTWQHYVLNKWILFDKLERAELPKDYDSDDPLMIEGWRFKDITSLIVESSTLKGICNVYNWMPVCHNCFLAYQKIDYFWKKLYMERAIREKDFVKWLKNPVIKEKEEDSEPDLGLVYCPKRKKYKTVTKHNFIEAYDTYIPIKKRLISEQDR